MSAVLQLDQRQAWLDWRREGIGASDAPAIVGLSPWSSPMRVWLDKTGQLGDQEPSEAMGWGNRLETAIADEFEARTGLHVADRQAWVVNDEWPVMRATLDGVVWAGGPFGPMGIPRDESALGVFESKCSSRPSEWEDGVPDHYQVQVQHQLAVTGLPKAWLAVLLNGNELRIYELERDEATIAALIDIERRFWQMVVNRTPPAVDGSAVTTDAIRDAYIEAAENSHVDLPAHAEELIAEYHAAAEAEKQAERRKAEAANGLKVLLGKSQVGFLAGEKVVTWSAFEKADFDAKALAAAHPEIHAQFVRVAPQRRLNVSKPKERP